MKIVDIEEARKAKKCWQSGTAVCMTCRHEWQAVAPVGAVELQCPNCQTMKGVFVEVSMRDIPHWTCNCGSYFMGVTPQGIYCANCGEWQRGHGLTS